MQKIIQGSWEENINSINNNSVDLVITDPPYGMSFVSNYRKEKHKKIKNDDNLEWLPVWVKELKRITKNDSHIYIFCSWHNIDVFKKELEVFFKVKNILIWEKNNTGMGDLKGDYYPKYEMIIFISNGNKKLNGTRDSNIIKAKRRSNDDHPTQKPSNLISYLIEKSSIKGDLVVDTFAGSCSVAIMCKEKQRRSICIELEKKYCDLAKIKLASTNQTLF